MPNGTLFGDGVCARIKEEPLKEFNLHTIVRLPKAAHSALASVEDSEVLSARMFARGHSRPQ